MKAVITGKSELRLSDLTREYTFNIINDLDEIALASQVITARPAEAAAAISSIVAEYETAYYEALDLDIGDEV
jgi:hypothetical protein